MAARRSTGKPPLKLVSALVLLLAACGHAGTGANGRSEPVTIHGALVHHFSYPCGFFKGYALQMAGPPLTVLDGQGNVIARAEASSARQVQMGGGRCTFEYPYGISLPRQSVYQIRVGETLSSPGVTVSYPELVAHQFRLDIPLD